MTYSLQGLPRRASSSAGDFIPLPVIQRCLGAQKVKGDLTQSEVWGTSSHDASIQPPAKALHFLRSSHPQGEA